MNIRVNPQILTNLIVRSRFDKAFKATLLADPKKALAQVGVATDNDVDIEIVQNTSQKVYFVLPADISIETSTDEEIEATTGLRGFSGTCSASYSCCCPRHAMVADDPAL